MRTLANYLCSSVCLSLAIGTSAAADTLLVPAQYPTIQAAVDAAVNGDTVLVSPGNYGAGFDFKGKRILVKGTLGALVTTIDLSANGGTAVWATSGEPAGTQLEGISLRGATSGALVMSGGSELNLVNCRIIECTKVGIESGSAIRAIGASIRASNCEIANHSSTHSLTGPSDVSLFGGAVAASSDSFLQFDYCTFLNCAVGVTRLDSESSVTTFAAGGAIAAVNSRVELLNCSLQNCRASVSRSNCAPTPCGFAGYGLTDSAGGAVYLQDAAQLTCVNSSIGTSSPCSATSTIERSEGYASPNPSILLRARGGAICVDGANTLLELRSCQFGANALAARIGSDYDSDSIHGSFRSVLATLDGCSVAFAPSSGSTPCLIEDCRFTGGSAAVELFVVGSPCVGSGCGGHNSYYSVVDHAAALSLKPGSTSVTLRDSEFWQVSRPAVQIRGGLAPLVTNCDFADNPQGGLRLEDTAATIIGSMFRRNGPPITAVNAGLGPTVMSCLFCENSPNALSGAWVDAGSNVFSAACVTNDCNGNGIDDGFEIQTGAALDCNHNGIPDSCDIAAHTSNDCDADEVPDECQFPTTTRTSLPLSPVQSGTTLTYAFQGLGVSGTDVVLSVTASADLSAATETVQVNSGSTILGTLFQAEGADCTSVTGELLISMQQFNSLLTGGGTLSLQFMPSFAVTPGTCTATSLVANLEYQTSVAGDCNANAIPDVCDILSGAATDANGNGVPDSCESAPSCPPDFNHDNQVGAEDIAFLLGAWGTAAADLTGDGTTGAPDLAALLSVWGPCR